MRLPISHTRLVAGERLLADGQPPAPRRAAAVKAAAGRGAAASAAAGAGDDADLPAVVLDRLDAIALLRDIPFGYLVPDLGLVPAESLRVFRVDETWVEAVQSGLLSVAERSTSDTLTRLTAPGMARVGPLTGFLLRSRVIVDHPGVRVTVHDAAGDQLEPVRIDRPAAGVLLVVVAGTLASITVEEPHHGLRLGLASGPGGGVVRPRGADGRLVAGAQPVTATYRAGAADGVLDLAALASRIDAAAATGVPGPTSSGSMALHLLRPPIRQRFSTGGGT